MRPLPFRVALSLLLLASPAAAQLPEARYEPVDTVGFGNKRFGRYGMVLIGGNGRLIVATDAFNTGQILAFDSTGKEIPGWGTPVGFRQRADIGWLGKWGWMGDSIWVADDGYRQLAILNDSGKVGRSVERPAWVRPGFGDRHRFPIFSAFDWEAAYPDGSVLITPKGPRAIFDTPDFDRLGHYLMRATADGKILRLIAKLPPGTGFTAEAIRLRDVTNRKSFAIPFAVKVTYKVSSDGQRIVIVQPLLTAQDSGAFRVTMLNADGDTVFVKRFQSEAARVNVDAVNARLNTIQDFGRYKADWIRDTIRQHIPVFESRVVNAQIGFDYSTWVWVRSTKPEAMALVIDPTGAEVGWVKFPLGTKVVALSRDVLWVVKADPTNRWGNGGLLVRYRRVQEPARRSVSRAR